MDSDSWIRLSTSSRRYQSRSDPFYIGEDIDSDEDSLPEFMCPFCAEDFDMVGLCCHIDEEHPVEGKNGVCPVCTKRVGVDLVGHITMQHGSLLKVQRRRRLRRGGSTNSTLSILRKELREGNLQSFLGGSSSCLVSSSNTEPDPWLSSFIFNPPVDDYEATSATTKLHFSIETSTVNETSGQDISERKTSQQSPPLSDKDQEEKARKCEFVQGLLMSTFLDDDDL